MNPYTIVYEQITVYLCLSVVQKRKNYRTDNNEVLHKNAMYFWVYFRFDIVFRF